jgi:hypothetical protein
MLTFVRRLFKFCVTERIESRLRVHPILDLPKNTTQENLMKSSR